MNNKIIRSICYFEKEFSEKTIYIIENISKKLLNAGYEIQTKRICSPIQNFTKFERQVNNKELLLGAGALNLEDAYRNLNDFFQSKEVSFNIDLSDQKIDEKSIKILTEIINNKSEHTFRFAYTFNNPGSSPFFPSAKYEKDGFSIGFQPTDSSEDCRSLEEWLNKMNAMWQEIFKLFKNEDDFLGIDSSIAPAFSGKGSLVNFIKRLGYEFNKSITTDIYIKITNFIKINNPKPIGLCGLMLPCLEDFELADEYEKGNFPIERNLFLSLQSGLGIDTYPVGINQNQERLLEVVKLTQKLSNKHNKSLSIRFVSDGKTKIGQQTDFRNEYLKDVVVREL